MHHYHSAETRRGFLRLAGGVLVVAGGLLEACSASAPASPTLGVPTAAAAPTSLPKPAVTVPPATAAAPTTAPVIGTTANPTASAALGAVQLPTRVPLQGLTIDLPASADGLIDAGLRNYPASLIKAVPDTPGRASTSPSPPGPPARPRRPWSRMRSGKRSTPSWAPR